MEQRRFPKIETVELADGITREKVVIQVEPGIYIPMFILIPKEIRPGGHP